MPVLDFKGKPFVYSHHLSVPFRELVIDKKKSLPGPGGPSLDDNLIIHGMLIESPPSVSVVSAKVFLPPEQTTSRSR